MTCFDLIKSYQTCKLIGYMEKRWHDSALNGWTLKSHQVGRQIAHVAYDRIERARDNLKKKQIKQGYFAATVQDSSGSNLKKLILYRLPLTRGFNYWEFDSSTVNCIIQVVEIIQYSVPGNKTDRFWLTVSRSRMFSVQNILVYTTCNEMVRSFPKAHSFVKFQFKQKTVCIIIHKIIIQVK